VYAQPQLSRAANGVPVGQPGELSAPPLCVEPDVEGLQVSFKDLDAVSVVDNWERNELISKD
jgi:hypothetical protein